MANSDLRYGIPVPYLRQWRIYRVMEQAELAEKAGVSRLTVVKGEQGLPLRLTTIRKLAHSLGLSREDLVHSAPGSQEM